MESIIFFVARVTEYPTTILHVFFEIMGNICTTAPPPSEKVLDPVEPCIAESIVVATTVEVDDDFEIVLVIDWDPKKCSSINECDL